jgi:hypothetical protein
MGRNSERNLERAGHVAGLIFALFCLLDVISAIAGWIHISFWAALAAAVAICGAVIAAVRAFGKAKKWFATQKPCSHDIRAGASGRCHICVRDAARIQRQLQLETQEFARRQRIAEKSRIPRRQGVERLSKAWLTNSESYFTIDSQEFENAIAHLFRALGYKVKQTQFSNDRGKPSRGRMAKST